MSVEATFERSMQAEAGRSPERQPVLVTIVLWVISIACIGFTMCYAYHIGL